MGVKVEQKFIQALTEQGDVAKKWAGLVPQVLAKDDLTKDQAQQMWDKLEELADAAEQLTEMMEDHNLEESFIEAGEALQDMFLDMHSAVGERLVKLGGLQGPPQPGEFD